MKKKFIKFSRKLEQILIAFEKIEKLRTYIKKFVDIVENTKFSNFLKR